MTSVALDPAHRRIFAEEFLRMDFDGARAELDDGIIYTMTGGSEAQSRIAGNILTALRVGLRGRSCRPYNSDFAVRTGERSVRFPDVTVYCRDFSAVDPAVQLMGDPTIIFEVLSPSTAGYDQREKLSEYRALDGVRAIVFVDPDAGRLRIVRRTGPESWTDDWLPQSADLVLSEIDLVLGAQDIFATD